MRKIAGVVLILKNKKVLLCKTNKSKHYDFPKGGIDVGETKLEAALRELKEETGVILNDSQIINPDAPIRVIYKRKGDVYKKLYLFVSYISDLSEINLDNEIIDPINLQADEIIWSGFVDNKKFIKPIPLINKLKPKTAKIKP